MSDIRSKAMAIIVDKLQPEDSSAVKPEASLTKDLGADSLSNLDLILEFEKEFSITIPDDEAEKIQTVGDVIAYLEKNVQQGQEAPKP